MNTLNMYICGLFLSVFFLSSCQKEENEPLNTQPKNLIKVGEAYALGAAAKVELWANADLKTGHNNLFVAVQDSLLKKSLNNVQASIVPMMKMNGMDMSHSAPFENVEPAQDKLFAGAAVFTMPSTGESGEWSVNVNIHNPATGKSGVAKIAVNVSEKKSSHLTLTSRIDNSKYIVSLVSPQKPTVGVNDFEILINKRVDGMSYPAVENLIAEIVPEMPDMDHGSPNNVNPVSVGKGRYKGKVNFTMTGYWKVNLTLKTAGGEVIADNAAFDITF